MILALSRPPYDIGAVRQGCTDGEGRWHEAQAFVVLREVSFEAWTAYCRAQRVNTSESDLPESDLRWLCRNDRFFEVSTD